jgi:hypothetical protein
MTELAEISHHMTPAILDRELQALDLKCPVYIFNIKPMYRDAVINELNELHIPELEILSVGETYFW